MEKLDCIKDYMVATKAYYLFWFGKYFNNSEIQQFILDKRNIIGAKISIISNIMLGIKEDLVENKGERNYQSRVFLKALEDTVENISTKVANGYKIGNYVFPDAETLVAIVRNKLAHGNFVIDFDHGRVIINHQGTDIVLSVYKLSIFIASAVQTMIRSEKTTKYERDMVLFTDPMVSNRKESFKSLGEIKRVIKGYEHITFTLESLDGFPVSSEAISLLEGFIDYVRFDSINYKNSSYYKDLCNVFSKKKYKLTINYKQLNNPNDVNEILALLGPELLNYPDDNLHRQIETIGFEVHRRLNPKLSNFNPLTANIKHLFTLDAISKNNTVNISEIGKYVTEHITQGNELIMYYDEYASLFINMFHAFFIYPFDNIYDIPGGYTLNRSDGLDFSLLDLSMLDVTYIKIDNTPLIEAKKKLDTLNNRQFQIIKKITTQENNLNRVNGNQNAISNIKANISSLYSNLSLLISEYANAYNDYTLINDDFSKNADYFRNKAIIEGIRNSIAHGNYEILPGKSFDDTVIIFSDIYEDKLTFQAKIKFSDFEKLYNVNTDILVQFIDNKIAESNGNILSKKIK